MLELLEADGYANHQPVLDASETQCLIDLIEGTPVPQGRGGLRDVIGLIPQLREVADHSAVRSIVDKVLGAKAFVVRATLFDKTDAANWKVPWHQDLTIAVEARHDVGGYGPWSVKAGVQHVQAPTHVLQRMLTVRVHLDPCPASNGALRVMPGSHRLGRIDQNDVSAYINESFAVVCEANAGEALVMRPLTLHTSSAAKIARHRRVLHFDYADDNLPDPLAWKSLKPHPRLFNLK